MEIIDDIKAQNAKGTTGRILALMQNMPKGNVLDAPAGHGPISQALINRGHTVTAIDCDTENFGAKDATLISADLNDPLPFDDGTFDNAVCADGIEHLESPYGCMREFARVLKPGGRFLFIEHVGASHGTWLRRIQRAVRRPWGWVADGCRPDRDTAEAIRAAGFASVELEAFRVPMGLASPHICGVAIR